MENMTNADKGVMLIFFEFSIGHSDVCILLQEAIGFPIYGVLPQNLGLWSESE